MMKELKSSIKRWGLYYCGICFGIIFFAACNKDFANRLSFDNANTSLEVKETKYKIAYIILEGGVGTIIAKEANSYGRMPTLGQLSLRSMVSWNAVSAKNKDALTSSADMLTGVEYPKHQVLGIETGNQLDKYPSIFSRLKDNRITQTSLITSSEKFEFFKKDVGNYQFLDSDEAVTAKAVEELEKDSSVMLVATYKDVDIAGETDGYDSPSYEQALEKFDNQLKKLVDAITKRKQYAAEQWMIVISSPKGGSYLLKPGIGDGTIFTDIARNNFVLINNNQFAFRLLERPAKGSTPWVSSAITYVGDNAKGIIAAPDAAIYNISNGQECTIELKIKIKSYGTANQTVFSKRSSTNGDQDGWAILIGRESTSGNEVSRGSFRFKVGGTEVYASADIPLNVWHSVIVRVYMDGTKQQATIFRNGVPYGTGDITKAKGVSSETLQLGYAAGYSSNLGKQSHQIADVRIYNVAKSIEDIKDSFCTIISDAKSDAYYENLIGYWPANDIGNELRDLSPSKRNFRLSGKYSWLDFSDSGTGLCPPSVENPERKVLRSLDVPKMIYSWLNFRGVDFYDLDAQYWSPSFLNIK